MCNSHLCHKKITHFLFIYRFPEEVRVSVDAPPTQLTFPITVVPLSDLDILYMETLKSHSLRRTRIEITQGSPTVVMKSCVFLGKVARLCQYLCENQAPVMTFAREPAVRFK